MFRGGARHALLLALLVLSCVLSLQPALALEWEEEDEDFEGDTHNARGSTRSGRSSASGVEAADPVDNVKLVRAECNLLHCLYSPTLFTAQREPDLCDRCNSYGSQVGGGGCR